MSEYDPDAWIILLPLLIVLTTFVFILLLFLLCIILIRRRRGIALRDNDGPVDMSREELIESEGGFETIEARWLEAAPENIRREYLRARGASFCRFFYHRWRLHSLSTRLSTSIFAQFSSDGYYTLPVSINTGERRISLVIRARL